MNKRDLKKLSKSQLIKMLLKQEKKKSETIVVDYTKKNKKPKQQKKVIYLTMTPFLNSLSQMTHLRIG